MSAPGPSRRKSGGSVLVRLRRIIALVPRGKVITYGQVAAAAGFPGAARLTVRALYGAQGLPWHRVVAAGGRIALSGIEGQEQRLRLGLEGVTFRGGRVRLDRHGWIPRSRPRRHGGGARAGPGRSGDTDESGMGTRRPGRSSD